MVQGIPAFGLGPGNLDYQDEGVGVEIEHLRPAAMCSGGWGKGKRHVRPDNSDRWKT